MRFWHNEMLFCSCYKAFACHSNISVVEYSNVTFRASPALRRRTGTVSDISRHYIVELISYVTALT